MRNWPKKFRFYNNFDHCIFESNLLNICDSDFNKILWLRFSLFQFEFCGKFLNKYLFVFLPTNKIFRFHRKKDFSIWKTTNRGTSHSRLKKMLWLRFQWYPFEFCKHCRIKHALSWKTFTAHVQIHSENNVLLFYKTFWLILALKAKEKALA